MRYEHDWRCDTNKNIWRCHHCAETVYDPSDDKGECPVRLRVALDATMVSEVCPSEFVATVSFKGYLMDENGAPYDGIGGLTRRMRECIETHSTLSFRIDDIKIKEV